MNLQAARANMIEQQVRPWDVLDQRVLDTLGDVPRETFLDPRHHGLAYSDFELPIGHGQHMLKPVLDGRFLQALALSPTDRVLEIGTGSGYLTACIARLARHVDSLELVPELSDEAAGRLDSLGVANVELAVGDAAADELPFADADQPIDAILFSGSVPTLPAHYRERLAVGGRLVVVVGAADKPTMDAQLITRIDADEWYTESLFETRLTPLRNIAAAPQPFVF